MKESMWGYLILALGIMVIAVIFFVQRLTTTNEQDYYLVREVLKSSMIDALDYGSYGVNLDEDKVVMSKEKFVAVFTRRFAESVAPDRTYQLDFYDIHEYPPKATVKVTTAAGSTVVNNEAFDTDLNTYLSAIIE